MTATAGQRLRAMETKYKQSDGEDAFAYQIAVHGHIPLPRREYSFHPTRRWRFDFAWVEQGLAVEIEGNGTGGHEGRHRSWEGFRTDAEKYNFAAQYGWHVLRFTTDQVEDMTAFDTLNDWFAARGHKAS